MSIHDTIAAQAFPLGIWVRCEVCNDNEWLAPKERVADFLASGWPKCCGQTMSVRQPTREVPRWEAES